MKMFRILAAAGMVVGMACGSAMAIPTAQTWIPSTDAKGYKEVTVNVINIQRFSPNKDGKNPSYYDVGITAGVLPLESLKLEIGVDFLTTNQSNFANDNHPIYFNAKLATPEDLGFKGMPAIAIGAYNLGTFDKPEVGLSTRQNIVYGLLARTLPVIGRISAGGYHGSSRALASGSNTSATNNNAGVMVSWDRTMSEISDKLWMGVDYMGGNNANSALSAGVAWAFSKQVTVLTGVQVYNPFYKVSAADNGQIPGGKPAFTTQLFVNF